MPRHCLSRGFTVKGSEVLAGMDKAVGGVDEAKGLHVRPQMAPSNKWNPSNQTNVIRQHSDDCASDNELKLSFEEDIRSCPVAVR